MNFVIALDSSSREGSLGFFEELVALVVIAEPEQGLALFWKGRRERIITRGHRFHNRADGLFEIDPEAGFLLAYF